MNLKQVNTFDIEQVKKIQGVSEVTIYFEK